MCTKTMQDDGANTVPNPTFENESRADRAARISRALKGLRETQEKYYETKTHEQT